MTLPAEAYKLEGISPLAYQHPADRAATAALRKVPYLDQVVRKLIALGYEQALRSFALGSAVRLGESQLPEVWALHRQVFNTLDIDDVPDVYLAAWPFANAYTIGTERPIVLLESELVRLLDADGRRAVLAHEAAHIHSDHVLYQTSLAIILEIGTGTRLPMFAGLPMMAIKMALLEWFRAAELSCDRAAALVTRDPNAVCRSLMTLAAGELSHQLNLDAFVEQGVEYDEARGVDRLMRLFNDLNLTHPLPVRRVRELQAWVRGGEYERIVGGEYLRLGEEPPLSDEMDAAGTHYSQRIGEAVGQAGTSLSEVGQQLGSWLSRQRPG